MGNDMTDEQKRYEFLSLKMMPVPELVEIVLFLQALTPEQRIDAMDYVKESAGFCFSCGRDVSEGEQCHCDNDE